MIPRRVGPLAALACAAIILSGCDGSPQPTPSTSAPLFATEAEAFAAAEATYRAYVDAVNLANEGRSGAEPMAFLTGDALDAELESRQMMEEAGTHVDGHLKVVAFVPIEYDAGSGSATASACLDVSETSIRDSDGLDVTPSNRPNLVGLGVGFEFHGELRIASMHPVAEMSPC